MADNVGYTPGTGALVAADEIAGVLHQRIKLGIGEDGEAVDVSAANPLPITSATPLAVTGPLTDAELRAVPLSVVDVNNAESLQGMIFLLTRMLNYLNSPQGYDKSLQRQRGTVVVESGTINVGTATTVTTVATVTNQANIGNIQGQILVNGGNMAAWQAAVRNRIT
jgi:hypothetical protein